MIGRDRQITEDRTVDKQLTCRNVKVKKFAHQIQLKG